LLFIDFQKNKNVQFFIPDLLDEKRLVDLIKGKKTMIFIFSLA